jgi:hypothetical protein
MTFDVEERLLLGLISGKTQTQVEKKRKNHLFSFKRICYKYRTCVYTYAGKTISALSPWLAPGIPT